MEQTKKPNKLKSSVVIAMMLTGLSMALVIMLSIQISNLKDDKVELQDTLNDAVELAAKAASTMVELGEELIIEKTRTNTSLKRASFYITDKDPKNWKHIIYIVGSEELIKELEIPYNY